MKLSTSDKATGKVHEVKGEIKQKAGEIVGNPCLKSKGRTEKNAGKAQNFVGKVEKAIGE
ncbi:MAG: CsbD family protein [Terracidiphilus sp.]